MLAGPTRPPSLGWIWQLCPALPPLGASLGLCVWEKQPASFMIYESKHQAGPQIHECLLVIANSRLVCLLTRQGGGGGGSRTQVCPVVSGGWRSGAEAPGLWGNKRG